MKSFIVLLSDFQFKHPDVLIPDLHGYYLIYTTLAFLLVQLCLRGEVRVGFYSGFTITPLNLPFQLQGAEVMERVTILIERLNIELICVIISQ